MAEANTTLIRPPSWKVELLRSSAVGGSRKFGWFVGYAGRRASSRVRGTRGPPGGRRGGPRDDHLAAAELVGATVPRPRPAPVGAVLRGQQIPRVDPALRQALLVASPREPTFVFS